MEGIYIQLYSLHEPAEEDFVGTLRQVAEIGFSGVEFAGYGGLSPEELANTLADLGLRAPSSHIALDQLENEWDLHKSYLKAVGAEFAVIPHLAMKTAEDAIAAAKRLEAVALRCAEDGITVAYHNHAHEFARTADGVYLMDLILERAPHVMFEPDLYWIQYAGVDPAAYLKRYADRTVLLHIKDIENMQTRKCVDVGDGMLDFAALRDLAPNSRYAIYEQEEYDVSCWVSAKRSFETMKTIF